MKSYKSIIVILALLAFIESLYIYLEPSPRKGLDLLFVVPLIFAICILSFGGRILPFQENGLGLKVYYIIILVRYLVQPILIVLSHGQLNFRMPETVKGAYPVAILIYIIELVIACLVIRRWYPIYFLRYRTRERQSSQRLLNLNSVTILVVYFLLLCARFTSWFPGMNILGIKDSAPDIIVVFEATVFNCLKVFVFIYFVIKSKKNVGNKIKFNIYFFLAIISGLFNFLSYFGRNRSFIYETAIATIAILIYAYPQYKKRVLSVLLPFALLIMVYSYVNKQFSTENAVAVATYDSQTVISNIVEEYANGIWTVARSYRSSLGLPLATSVEAFVKDILDGLSGLRDLPGFKSIYESFTHYRSSSDIFKNTIQQEDDRGQMLSLSGGFLIIGGGGEFYGWIFLFIGNFVMIILLVYMDVKSKITNDIYYKYMYVWMAILMGLVHCYCLQTIIYCWSKFILFYWIVLWINKITSKRKLDS